MLHLTHRLAFETTTSQDPLCDVGRPSPQTLPLAETPVSEQEQRSCKAAEANCVPDLRAKAH